MIINLISYAAWRKFDKIPGDTDIVIFLII